MVLVEYRLAEGGTMEMDWMPVMMPYGGPGYGMYLMPETGTEVVIGFRFGDRSKPFVMGALLENMDSVPKAEGTAAQLSALTSLQLKSDGIVEVRGSMVKLN